MNIVDYIILFYIVISALLGFKRGFFKQTVKSLGAFVIVILAFLLKNPLSLLLYKNLPFFKFGGMFEGVSSINILMYEILAFVIALAILSIALNILIKITGIIEKILTMTIILALPSKLLGMVVGIIEGVIVLYVTLLILTLPVLNIPYVSESKYSKLILENTPIISNVTGNIIKTFNESTTYIKENVKLKEDKRVLNKNLLEIMLKNDVISSDNVLYLIEQGKIDIDNVDELISKYEED